MDRAAELRSKKKVEIRKLFAECRSTLDLASVLHRLHFGTLFRNYSGHSACDSKKKSDFACSSLNLATTWI